MSDGKRILTGPPPTPRPVGAPAKTDTPAPASSLLRKNRVAGPPPTPSPAVPLESDEQVASAASEPVSTSDGASERPIGAGSWNEPTAVPTTPGDGATDNVPLPVQLNSEASPGATAPAGSPETSLAEPSEPAAEATSRTSAAAVRFEEAPPAADAPRAASGTAAPASSTAREDAETAPARVKQRRNADPKGQNPDDLLKVTFDVRREDRDAFNAAVKAAVLFEGHKNAGAFLAYIYNRERERLENDYNQGRPFERRVKPLPRGGSFQKRE